VRQEPTAPTFSSPPSLPVPAPGPIGAGVGAREVDIAAILLAAVIAVIIVVLLVVVPDGETADASVPGEGRSARRRRDYYPEPCERREGGAGWWCKEADGGMPRGESKGVREIRKEVWGIGAGALTSVKCGGAYTLSPLPNSRVLEAHKHKAPLQFCYGNRKFGCSAVDPPPPPSLTGLAPDDYNKHTAAVVCAHPRRSSENGKVSPVLPTRPAKNKPFSCMAGAWTTALDPTSNTARRGRADLWLP